jgi:hypothetical protein
VGVGFEPVGEEWLGRGLGWFGLVGEGAYHLGMFRGFVRGGPAERSIFEFKA